MDENLTRSSETVNQPKRRLASLWSTWQISAILVSTYVGVLAVDLGANGVEQSLVTGVQTIGNASLQGVWGSLSDRFGRRPFMLLGLVAVGMTAALVPLAQTASQLILIMLVPTIVGSAAIPAWNGLLGDLTTMHIRGRFVGLITAVGTVASSVALVVVGFTAVSLGLTGLAAYHVPLYLSAVVMIIAVVCVLSLRETVRRTSRHLFSFRSAIRDTPRFTQFLLVNGIFFFAMGLAWPFFPIITRGILQADVFQVGILQALFGICSGAAQIGGGWVADHLGRKPVVLASRFFICLAPFFHALGALTFNLWFLVPSNIAGGLTTGLFLVGSSAWLLDAAPAKDCASIVALFNFVTGVTSFLGALLSGFLYDSLVLVIDLRTVLVLMMSSIVVIRTIAAFGYLSMHETLVKKAARPTAKACARTTSS
jgi:DHA1 family multidrug resistance protein-like MFS transporter